MTDEPDERRAERDMLCMSLGKNLELRKSAQWWSVLLTGIGAFQTVGLAMAIFGDTTNSEVLTHLVLVVLSMACWYWSRHMYNNASKEVESIEAQLDNLTKEEDRDRQTAE